MLRHEFRGTKCDMNQPRSFGWPAQGPETGADFCFVEMIQQPKRGTKGDEVNSSGGEVSFELDGFEDVFIVVFF